ncbi:hypothetical protein EC919_102167 [Pseudomonas graminis]|uniref:hypothetical protein n=1 Tax=Pseudomonas graminis TaxID=158627 RepID=UPI00105EFDCA|nr:hypothetical protein [Pseudomonas graminis]TDV56797.1 hypothetical protein EC919_102167 [Pseudomonas graminis]
MSTPQLPQTHNRRELRKALIRLRMEMHRQEIRQESSRLMHPLQRMRGMASDLPGSLGIKHGPLWGVGAVTLLGFLTGKGTRSKKTGSVTRLIKLSATVLPLIKMALQNSSRRR